MANIKIGGEWYSSCDSCKRAASIVYYNEPSLLCKSCYDKSMYRRPPLDSILEQWKQEHITRKVTAGPMECGVCGNKVAVTFIINDEQVQKNFSLKFYLREKKYKELCWNCCNKFRVLIDWSTVLHADPYRHIPTLYSDSDPKRTKREYPFDSLTKINAWIEMKAPDDEDFTKFIANVRSSLSYFKNENNRDFKTKADYEKKQLIIIRTK